MSVLENIIPATIQTPKQAGRLARWTRAGAITLAGTGAIGGVGYMGVNQYEQAGQIRELTDEVSRNQDSMQKMLTQINGLNGEASRNKLSIQNMLTQLNSLNRELNTKITLDRVMGVVKNVTPSTVKIEGSRGHGSGVILITPYGRYILTNGHIVQGNDFRNNETGDSTYHIKLFNGTDYSSPVEFDAAPVLLSNGQRALSPPGKHDLALLQIPPGVQLPFGAGVLLRNLTTHPVQTGEPVIAVGNPFGERDSITFGIISHRDRHSSLNINHHFQTDAPMNPGNSGGGLFDMQGRLVGINTYIHQGGAGIAGSIKIDEVIRVLDVWGVH